MKSKRNLVSVCQTAFVFIWTVIKSEVDIRRYFFCKGFRSRNGRRFCYLSDISAVACSGTTEWNLGMNRLGFASWNTLQLDHCRKRLGWTGQRYLKIENVNCELWAAEDDWNFICAYEHGVARWRNRPKFFGVEKSRASRTAWDGMLNQNYEEFSRNFLSCQIVSCCDYDIKKSLEIASLTGGTQHYSACGTSTFIL